MNTIRWRWEEKDFGFRFKDKQGRKTHHYYQSTNTDEYYLVPGENCKLEETQIDRLDKLFQKSKTTPKTVLNPWSSYEQDWDFVIGPNGICLNYAGCLDPREIEARESIGLARAFENLGNLQIDEPITENLIRQIHFDIFGDIYPFAGRFRSCNLTKGDAVWLLPGNWTTTMTYLETEIFSQTPFYSDDEYKVCEFAARLMSEFLAAHPFREGNGRTTRILASIIFLQNDLPPLSEFRRQRDEQHYISACETGRKDVNHEPLTQLVHRWLQESLSEVEQVGGGPTYG